jgi:hypothetical protein
MGERASFRPQVNALGSGTAPWLTQREVPQNTGAAPALSRRDPPV